MKVVAGIVLFNPTLNRLKENIVAISSQVDELIFFDNGSKNIRDIEKLIKKMRIKGKVIYSESNGGIAYALNRISQLAIQEGFDWLLTLDQDTVVFPGLIKEYSKKIEDLPHLGQLTCDFIDRNRKEKRIKKYDAHAEEVKYCITSGALLNLNAYQKTDGFDEYMFIDKVDDEMCCALRKAGFKTYKIGICGFIQEIGHLTKHHFLYKTVYTNNYPPIRYYYMSRNSLYIAKKYPKEEKQIKYLMNNFKLLCKVMLYEKNKREKLKAILKGTYEGIIV